MDAFLSRFNEPDGECALALNGDLNSVTGLETSPLKPTPLEPDLGRDPSKPCVTGFLNFEAT